MNKKQRALKAAKAAKRIPLVGTTVIAVPILDAAASSGIGQRFMTIAGWQAFLNDLKFQWTGLSSGGNSIDPVRLGATWIPILAYALSYKFGIAKYPNRILGKLGLRF